MVCAGACCARNAPTAMPTLAPCWRLCAHPLVVTSLRCAGGGGLVSGGRDVGWVRGGGERVGCGTLLLRVRLRYVQKPMCGGACMCVWLRA
jgi:hypothetical protein